MALLGNLYPNEPPYQHTSCSTLPKPNPLAYARANASEGLFLPSYAHAILMQYGSVH